MSYINKTNKMKPIMDPSINILYTPPYSVQDLRSFPKIKFPVGYIIVISVVIVYFLTAIC